MLHDITSPLPSTLKVSEELVRKGIGDVGNGEIPECVSNGTIHCKSFFLVTASQPGSNIKPLGTHAQGMLRAMWSASDSLFAILFFISESGEPLNGWVFVVPNKSKKHSQGSSLVELNGRMGGKPPPLYLSTVEDIIFLMQSHCSPKGGGLNAYVPHMWAFIIVVGGLNCQFRDAFRLSDGKVNKGDGNISILRLPFGWKHSTVLCQRILQFGIQCFKKAQTLILYCWEDFIVLGFDEALVAEATISLVNTLVGKVCLILPESFLAPVRSLAWLGKQFDLASGSMTNSEGGSGGGSSKLVRFSDRILYQEKYTECYRRTEMAG